MYIYIHILCIYLCVYIYMYINIILLQITIMSCQTLNGMQRVDLNEHTQLAALSASALNQVLTAQRPCERLKNLEVVQGIGLPRFALAK